tara:strand:- start:788 stop:1579 length:792 start_codon:yes stop_codon:yes gene_type:complete
MSKRLPYYQSEPAEYLAGDIMFCSYAAQGVFSIIRALYWQKDCNLTLTQVKRRFKDADEFILELINENIIKVELDNISISFLDEQFEKASGKSKANSENGKKGAAKRWANKGIDSESIATPLNKDSESIALREDKGYKIKDILKESTQITLIDSIKEIEEQFTEQQFLKRWKEARLHFDKLPTNISELKQWELVNFNNIKKTYNRLQIEQAIQGMFEQDTFKATRLRPSHFLELEHFEKYLTCFTTKEVLFKKTGFNKQKDRI